MGKCAAAILSLLLISASGNTLGKSKTIDMEKVAEKIDFTDDIDFKNMQIAIDRQLEYFNRTNLRTQFSFGSRLLRRSHLKTSLKRFNAIVKETVSCLENGNRKSCYEEMSNKLNSEFEIYRPVPLKWEKGYKDKKTLFTSYYSPSFVGSSNKSDEFKYPIYAKPKSKKLQHLTSDQINYTDALKGKGLELFYVNASLYDIWLLHVEGGGRVRVKRKDGTFKNYYLSYDGTNSKSFAMLYKKMKVLGLLDSGVTIEDQRRAFNENPELQRKILASCPSYVWFKVTEDEPLGVHNIPLTSRRSLATDYRRMQEYGVINFVKFSQEGHDNPDKNISFSQFFLNQDTGGAIEGNARSDLYFGYGKKAELAANHIHDLGEQYFLILK